MQAFDQSELISIITPCYNSEAYIQETMDSVLNQTYKNFEWIIVDDRSNDSCVEMIRKRNDERIRLYCQEENLGPAHARNRGLKKAKGRFITFIDSDDIWMPQFLEKAINFLTQNKEEVVYASYTRANENLKPILKDFIAFDKVKRERLFYNCPLPMLTSMYDSKRIGKVEFPNITKREDHAMWIDLLEKVPYARAIKETLGVYRMRENTRSSGKVELFFIYIQMYNGYFGVPLYKSIYYAFMWIFYGLRKYS